MSAPTVALLGDDAWKCVASTSDKFNRYVATVEDYKSGNGSGSDSDETSTCSSTSSSDDNNKNNISGLPEFIRSAQVSADGRMIVAHTEGHRLRTFLIPDDITGLDARRPRELWSNTTIPAPAAIRSYALYPFFDLNNTATTVFAWSVQEQPLYMRNAVEDWVHGGYSLIDKMTEAYISPTSLAWTPDGTGIVAGSKDQITIFDAHRPWEDPSRILRAPRAHSFNPRDAWPGIRATGLYTALAMSSDGVLAAGNTERCIVLFNHWGRGEFLGSHSLHEADLRDRSRLRRGNGITQMEFSFCGRYLLVAERRSDCIQVFDIRNMPDRLACLTGRKADTPQRMGFALRLGFGGLEVWAGGTDGVVRVWDDVGTKAGEQQPDGSFKAHDDVVTTVAWQAGNYCLVTTSGQWSKDAGEMRENSIKLWMQ